MKKKKGKQLGFTLIELLVVIALMLSVLGIAIVSFINVSDKKKKEAWEDVKAQIETAATEYFTANEYLFEGLKDDASGIIDGASGTISVGKLVTDDYLNKVTNPTTGRSVSSCAEVKVTKTGNKLTAVFDETTENSTKTNCDSDDSIIVTSPGAPSFKMDGTCWNRDGINIGDDADGWCYKKEFKLSDVNANGTITSIKHCNASGLNCVPDTDDGVNSGVTIKGYNATSQNAITAVSISNQTATTTMYKGYKIDRDIPYGSVTLGRNTGESYNSNTPKVSINAKDDHSGLSSASFKKAKNSTTGDSSWDLSRIGNSWTPTVEHFTVYEGPGLSNQYVNGSGATIRAGDIALTVTDKVGNVGILNNNAYTLYTRCSEKNSSTNTTWSGNCSNICGGTETGSKYTTYTDKYLGGTCDTPVYAGADSRSCGGTTTQYGSWSKYGKCESGKKTKTRTVTKISTYDGKSVCSRDTEKDTKNCTTCEITKSKDIYGMIDSFDINLGVNVSCNGIGPWTYSDNKTNGEQACAILKTKNSFTLDGFAGAWGSSYNKTGHHISWNNASKNNKTFYKRTGCSKDMTGSSACDPSQSRYVTVCAVVKIDGANNCKKKEFTICRGRNYDTKEYSKVNIY